MAISPSFAAPHARRFAGSPAASRRDADRTRLWLLGMRVFVFAGAITLMASQTQALYGTRLVDAGRWAILGLLLLMVFVRPRGRIAMRKPVLADGIFAAFTTLCFASLLYSVFPALTMGRSISGVLFFGAVFWSVWLFADAVGASKVVDSLLAAASLMFIAGVVNALLGNNAWYALRYRGVFGNPNTIGMLSIVFLPPAVGQFIRTRKMSALLLIGLIAGSLVLSGSRNGVMTSSIAVVFLLYRIRAWRSMTAIASAAVVLLLVMPTPTEMADQDPVARLTSAQKIATGGGRLEAWTTALPIIREKPLLGYGFGTEELIFRGRTFRVHRGEYIHNSYLGIAYQLGIIGALVLFVPLFALLLKRITARGLPTVQLAVCEAVLLGGLIASMFESWIYSAGNAFAFPFWILVMLLVRAPLAPPDPNDRLPVAVRRRVRPPLRYSPPLAIRDAVPRDPVIPRFDPPDGGTR
jgi:O-antigen ligase